MHASQNQLIALLPRKDRIRFLSIAKPVDLTIEHILCEHGSRTRYAYFPVEGLISLIAHTPDHPGLEVGMVGREGMVGIQLALGVSVSPLEALVQGSGSALRIESGALRAEIASSVALQRILNRYAYVLMAQLATAASCVRFHLIAPRLARWLLMTQDRAQSDRFPVTQEFMGFMLGVRRVGITAAAKALQRDGLVEYSRGEMHVLDRARLESMACVCYRDDLRIYRQWIH